MTTRMLIVARIRPGATDDVARLFGASDETELPHRLGVVRRDLYEYQGLYFHQVEFAGDRTEAMATARDRDDFKGLSADLDAFIAPYDPATWRSPADAMASGFYTWTPEAGVVLPTARGGASR